MKATKSKDEQKLFFYSFLFFLRRYKNNLETLDIKKHVSLLSVFIIVCTIEMQTYNEVSFIYVLVTSSFKKVNSKE